MRGPGAEQTGARALRRPGAEQTGSGALYRSGGNEMKITEQRNSNIIDGMTFGFSAALFLGCIAGALYTGTLSTLPRDFFRILTTPGPLVTDYFMIGSMPATFLNAGLCGLTRRGRRT